jgi:serine-type D-Ala-D-Ala carboxypeptidase/endopeptidase (penicillin-binding protein 4)
MRTCLIAGLVAGLAVPQCSLAQFTATGAPPVLESPVAPLVERIESIMAGHDLQEAHWGVLIRSLESGETWYEQNPGKQFVPASNQKIPTTAAVLMKLGPDFRFETTLSHTGTIQGDTLHGDLVVRSNGDVTLSERFHDDSRDVFFGWAEELKDRGIVRITGNVVGDDNAWEDSHVGSGWVRGSGAISAWYYAEYGPLTLTENVLDIVVRGPESPDGEAVIEVNVPSNYYTIVNNVRVVEDGSSSASARREEGSNVITVSGRVTPDGRATTSCTITNPTLWYATVLKESLEEAGIEIGGMAVDIDDLEGWNDDTPPRTTLAVHHSPPLSDIATMLMKRSQNMFAESMVYALGLTTGDVATFSNGRQVLAEQLEQLGVEPGSYSFSDASGLSRYNFVSPDQIVTMLTSMRDHELWDIWYDTFPIMGVDGTLRNRSRDTPIQGMVRAKTGTLSSVRALSGYTETADGEPVVFSFLVNGHRTGAGPVDRVIDSVLTEIVTFSRDSD